MNDFNPNNMQQDGPEAGGQSAGELGLAGVPEGVARPRGLFSRKRNVVIGAGIAVVAVAGVATGVALTSGSSGGSAASSSVAAGSTSGGPGGQHQPFGGGGGGGGSQGSNARSTNEPGGTSGTVSNLSGSGFTVTTTVGSQLTVTEGASTTFQDASSGTATAASANAVTASAGVLVVGTVNGTTITATQVTVEPEGSPYTTASSDVTAMQRGQQNTSKTYGTIPADYTEGQGTIVDAGTADQAVVTALAKYPGGLVDRVVKLPDGDYEVHDIGTSMHHIFEDPSFQVIGAN